MVCCKTNKRKGQPLKVTDIFTFSIVQNLIRHWPHRSGKPGKVKYFYHLRFSLYFVTSLAQLCNSTPFSRDSPFSARESRDKKIERNYPGNLLVSINQNGCHVHTKKKSGNSPYLILDHLPTTFICHAHPDKRKT